MGYINQKTKKFKIHVADWVQFNQDNAIKGQWRYAESKQNLHDFISRGIEVDSLNKKTHMETRIRVLVDRRVRLEHQ